MEYLLRTHYHHVCSVFAYKRVHKYPNKYSNDDPPVADHIYSRIPPSAPARENAALALGAVVIALVDCALLSSDSATGHGAGEIVLLGALCGVRSLNYLKQPSFGN